MTSRPTVRTTRPQLRHRLLRAISGAAAVVACLCSGCYPGLDAIDKETTNRIQQAADHTGTPSQPVLPDIRSKYEGNYFVEDAPNLRAPLTNNPSAKELTFRDAKDADIKRENANIDADTAMGTMLKYGS